MRIIKEAVSNPLEDLMQEATHNFENVQTTAGNYVRKLSSETRKSNYLPLSKEALNAIDEILDNIDRIIAEMEKYQ